MGTLWHLWNFCGGEKLKYGKVVGCALCMGWYGTMKVYVLDVNYFIEEL